MHGVRQHDRMRLGVRQVEASAEHMTELVVQRHACRAERDAAEGEEHAQAQKIVG